MKYLVLIAAVAALTACGSVRETVYDTVARAADRYCAETIDAGTRQTVIDKINEKTEKATVSKIECE